MGEVYDAERLIADVLDGPGEDLETLGLYAKVKHVKGELSAAIACWAQLHSRAPKDGNALMHLSSMLQLARDPERGAGEFLALGPFQLWRKPAAHLELEEAFRLFLARRPDEARAKCERMARRYADREPELHKLSVLAAAWIAELSGDVGEACTTLEKLGDVRGFATDPDRIIALARLYERSGTPEHLEKALNVCEYLEQHVPRTSVLGRLASLHKALGREEDATRYRRRFLLAFRRRMHRPSPHDVADVAARHYLPLQKLLDLRFPEEELEGGTPCDADDGEDVARRRKGVRSVLAGDRQGALALFRRGSSPIDLKYQADLAALDGDVEGAVPLYLRSLDGDPSDVRVLGWLLSPPRGSAVAAFFRDPSVALGARKALERAVQASPRRPSLWRFLGALHEIRGETDGASRCSERAAILDEAAERTSRAVGRSLAAAVYHFGGVPRGLVHEVWAQRRPTAPGKGGHLEEMLGNLTPEMVSNVRNTFLSVREYARAKLPHLTKDALDHAYTYKITKEDEPSGGLSGGLPTALGFLSVFVNRPLPQDVASSGTLVSDAHDVLVVKPVGEAEHKARGAYNRNLRMLLLPRDNRRDLRSSPLVPPAVCGEMVRYVADLDEAVSLVFGPDIWVA